MDTQLTNRTGKIAFVGFGEAAGAFVSGWAGDGLPDVSAFDIKTESADAAVRDAKLSDYETAGIVGCPNIDEALADADVVVSVVTADQALAAAKAAAAVIRPRAFYLDCNSCSPGTKREAAVVIDGAGGRYVDVAVMAPVYPKMHKTPLLISGPHADDALSFFDAMDMDAQVTSDAVGASSSIKMIRSVMIKGMEALTLECMLAARKAGIEDVVLDSLEQSYPGFGWRDKAAYNMERVMSHGIRRASEMRAVAETVRELGFSGDMAAATAAWQQTVGELRIRCQGEDVAERADEILQALKK